jgi:hypothetical protein
VRRISSPPPDGSTVPSSHSVVDIADPERRNRVQIRLLAFDAFEGSGRAAMGARGVSLLRVPIAALS